MYITIQSDSNCSSLSLRRDVMATLIQKNPIVRGLNYILYHNEKILRIKLLICNNPSLNMNLVLSMHIELDETKL